MRRRSAIHDEPFERALSVYPSRYPDNPMRPAYSAWQARVKEGVDPARLHAATVAYRDYCRRTGIEGTRFVLMAATFYGPNSRWEAYEPKRKPKIAPAAPRKEAEPEERIDGRAFIREIIGKLSKKVGP